MAFLTDVARSLWSLLLDTGGWLILGLLFAGVVHVLIPRAWLTAQLGGRGAVPILKASLLGIPLPLCSCSVIPVAAGLRANGAGKGASAAFAISTPQTGEESIPLTWALFGPVFALTRPVVAVATAFTAGVLIERLAKPGRPEETPTPGRDHDLLAGKPSCCEAPKPEEASSSCCASKPGPAPKAKPCCSSKASDAAPARPPLPARLSEVLRYGFVTMLRDLAPWLAVGLILSAVIAAAVPEGWIESNVGTGLLPMLAMLLVGLPLYICATSSTPLAYTLVVAGLSPGAALVLLLAGPATNAATMAWVLKDLGRRALVIYLVTIAVFSVACGFAFDALLGGTITLADHSHAHEHGAVGVLQIGGAVVFTALLLWALAARYAPKLISPAKPDRPSSCCSAAPTNEART